MLVRQRNRPNTVLVGMKTTAVTMEIRRDAIKILKLELLYDPDKPFLHINLEDSKSVNHRDT